MNQHGLSDIIATVLIIALSSIAVSLLWSTIRSSINLAPSFDCAALQINQPIEVQQAEFNPQTGKVKLILQRKITDETKINEISFTIQNLDGSVGEFYCGQGCQQTTLPNLGETRVYYASVNENTIPVEVTFGINSCTIYRSTINFNPIS